MIQRYKAPTTKSVKGADEADMTVVKTLAKKANPLGTRNGWFFNNMEVTKGTAITTYHDVHFLTN